MTLPLFDSLISIVALLAGRFSTMVIHEPFLQISTLYRSEPSILIALELPGPTLLMALAASVIPIDIDCLRFVVPVLSLFW